MKIRNTVLRFFFCLAAGGLVTVGIICFFIGFGIHSTVGKYALYTAFFLQTICLCVNSLVGHPHKEETQIYTPSRKMLRFRFVVELIWATGAALHLSALALILVGFAPTDPWVRYLTFPGIILCPIGWLGILMASHRRRIATDLLLSRRVFPGSQNDEYCLNNSIQKVSE